jgi:hypothetical protein
MIDQLDESTGFPNREFGDVYHSPINKDDVLIFQDFKAYPDDAVQWTDSAKRDKAWNKIQHYLKQVGEIKELNKPNAGMLGVLVVHMMDPKTKKHWFFCKWVRDLSVVKGKFTGIPAGAIADDHPGFVYKKGASESYKLKPSDIMGGEGPFTPQQVVAAVKRIPGNAGPPDLIEQLQFAVEQIATRKPWPITIIDGAQNMSFHTKYTNEWLAPLVLSAGMIPKQDRTNIELNLMAKKSMVNSSIYYSKGVSDTLSDSSIEKEGFRVYISSKQQGGGAAASILGIYEVLTKKRSEFGTGFFKQPKVAQFDKIVKLIVNSPSLEGMLAVAIMMGVITDAEYELILAGQVNKLPAKTKKLAQTFNARKDNPRYNPYFHLIAAIATATCARLNQIDFTDVFKAIINKASLVQCYLHTKIRNTKDLDLLDMQTVWPPIIEGKITFTAQKNFTSSEVRGRLGFKIG